MRYNTIDRRRPYVWATFDRPDKLNVLHAEDLPELRDIIVNLDPGVTGLVFTGAGRAAFSAGMNIETFVGMDHAGAKAFIGQLAGIMQSHPPVAGRYRRRRQRILPGRSIRTRPGVRPPRGHHDRSLRPA
jgi:enoyl-CoA hydratase/carnithine racemase